MNYISVYKAITLSLNKEVSQQQSTMYKSKFENNLTIETIY